MDSKSGASSVVPPKEFWALLKKYLELTGFFEKTIQEIKRESETSITQFRKERGYVGEAKFVKAKDILHYFDEFVENLLSYYSYYRSYHRSLTTLFASVGITDSLIFAEMVQFSSDPQDVIRTEELDGPGMSWFLNQFLSDYETVEFHRERLLAYLPRLKIAAAETMSGTLQRFLDVLSYISSDEAALISKAGLDEIKNAIDEEDLGGKLSHVVKSIKSFVNHVQNHPVFILTDSPGYFGSAELDEFDKKTQSFEQLREQFRDYVSLCDRTEWVFQRHHMTVFSSIFSGKHLQLVDIMHKVRRGGDFMEYVTQHRDCQEMLLGISQANTLFLEYSAYQEQMLGLVNSYKQLADLLQCQVMKIFYDMEIRRNNLYVEARDKFKELLEAFQQTLLEVCSLDTNSV
ncbi:MAG: hypothetical protein ACFFDP_03260 [Promethearchaeota archaeon]